MRILFDVILIVACVFAPWLLSATLVIIGLLTFDAWYEGLLGVLLLDIVIFGGQIGLHTLYMILGFCAVYYLSIRFKEMLRIV